MRSTYFQEMERLLDKCINRERNRHFILEVAKHKAAEEILPEEKQSIAVTIENPKTAALCFDREEMGSSLLLTLVAKF